jgi:cell division protein FtsN
MEQADTLQLDLFSQTNSQAKSSSRYDASFFRLIKAYERILMTIIAIALTGIISFSLGVEKGKRIQSPLQTQIRYEAALKQPAPVVIAPAKDNKAPVAPALNNPENITTGYTIQLASYRTKTYAQKEAQALKNRGLAPMIVSKKDFTVLYVGNFSDKQKAQPLLSELKKRYQNCYIIKRRL